MSKVRTASWPPWPAAQPFSSFPSHKVVFHYPPKHRCLSQPNRNLAQHTGRASCSSGARSPPLRTCKPRASPLSTITTGRWPGPSSGPIKARRYPFKLPADFRLSVLACFWQGRWSASEPLALGVQCGSFAGGCREYSASIAHLFSSLGFDVKTIPRFYCASVSGSNASLCSRNQCSSPVRGSKRNK